MISRVTARGQSLARNLKVELYALYLAARHPQTPWYAKLVVAAFVAYAVTPVAAPVLAECRGRAAERIAPGRHGWALMLALWAGLAAAGIAFYI
jgi:hypothetical protein